MQSRIDRPPPPSRPHQLTKSRCSIAQSVDRSMRTTHSPHAVGVDDGRRRLSVFILVACSACNTLQVAATLRALILFVASYRELRTGERSSLLTVRQEGVINWHAFLFGSSSSLIVRHLGSLTILIVLVMGSCWNSLRNFKLTTYGRVSLCMY